MVKNPKTSSSGLAVCLLALTLLSQASAWRGLSRPKGNDEAAPSTSNGRLDAIVIGAGMSGISAANKLSAEGYKVVVLEARDRLGGRSWTGHMKRQGWAVDLGGAWIHGIRHNPLHSLAKKLGLKLAETHYDVAAVRNASGALLGDFHDEFGEEEQFWSAFRHDLQIERTSESIPAHESIKQFVDSYLEEHPDKADNRLLRRRFYMELFDTYKNEYAGRLGDLSAMFVESDGYLNRSIGYGSDALIEKGYEAIWSSLAQSLDIRLNSIVERIAYGPQGVTVTTQDGTAFSAPYSIVTLPLGVLKAGDAVFEPPLPHRKQQAIKYLGYGTMDKLVLAFDKPFWDKNADILVYDDPTDELARGGYFRFTVNLYSAFGIPGLMMFNAAKLALELEPLSDEQTVAAGMAVLRNMYGTDIPEPQEALVTRWAADPFSKGAYSFIGKDSRPEDYFAMAQPVANRLFFAGEATLLQFSGTVQGAYISGIREAHRVMDMLLNNQRNAIDDFACGPASSHILA